MEITEVFRNSPLKTYLTVFAGQIQANWWNFDIIGYNTCKQVSSLTIGKSQSLFLCSEKETSLNLLTLDLYFC